MQFAAAFVEYLVIGSVAAIWLLPLARAMGFSAVDALSIQPQSAVVGLAVLYVVGMVIDTSAAVILDTLRLCLPVAPNCATRFGIIGS